MSQGAAIVNDASDFAGTNGCYLYQGRDVKEDCSTQEDIFNYPQNDKSEAADNPLPHFSIMTLNLVLPLTHISNTKLPHTPWVLRVPVQ